MGYIRAEKILPLEIIELIQEYVDGENIYIPKKEGSRREWGQNTQIKQEMKVRNQAIYLGFLSGQTVNNLANQYYLSEKSIQRIIRSMNE